MNRKTTFHLTTLAALLMAIYGSAMAEDDEGVDIGPLIKPESTVSFGLGNFNGQRQLFGKFDGLQDDETYFLLDADVRLRDDASGTWITATGRNLGIDSQEAALGYEQQGNWGVSLWYNQIPSFNQNTYMTGVTGIGSTTQTYGTIGTHASSSSTATINAQAGLNPATREVHLGTERDIVKLDLFKFVLPDLSVNVSFRNEEKEGTRHWGRGSNPEFAVEPIDSTTRQLDAILNYATDAYQLSGGMTGSWYENQHSFVDTVGGSQTWVQNSTSTPAGHTFLSLPLDNAAYQLFLNGGYNFNETTRGTFKMAYTHATQDDSLNPLTNALLDSDATGTNTYIPFTPGVPNSLDGEVNTTMLDLGLSARPMSELSLVANLRYNKRDDQTPVQTFGHYWSFRCTGSGSTTQYAGDDPTVVDYCGTNSLGTVNTTPSGSYTGPSLTEIENNPRDFKNLAGKLEATWRLPDGYSLVGGMDYDKRERSFERDSITGDYEGVVKMRGENAETTWRLQVRRLLSETLNGSLAFLRSSRDGSSWALAEEATEADLPLNYTNPAPYADRDRNKWRLMLDWTPTLNTSLQLNYERAKDDYGAGPSGLQDGNTQLLSLDGAYTINPKWQLTAWASHDSTKTHQIGYTYDTRTTTPPWDTTTAEGGAGPDLIWNAHLKDTGNALGIGLRGKPTHKLVVGADLEWNRTQSEYPIDSNVLDYNTDSGSTPTNRSQQGLPDITSHMTRLALFGEYAIQKNADLRVDLARERWKSDDWTWMEWDAAGTKLVPFTYMDGTRVIMDHNQSNTFLGVRYIYRFH